MPDSTADEFKNVGTHLGAGQYITVAVDGDKVGAAFTVEGWFIWLEGPGLS